MLVLYERSMTMYLVKRSRDPRGKDERGSSSTNDRWKYRESMIKSGRILSNVLNDDRNGSYVNRDSALRRNV